VLFLAYDVTIQYDRDDQSGALSLCFSLLVESVGSRLAAEIDSFYSISAANTSNYIRTNYITILKYT